MQSSREIVERLIILLAEAERDLAALQSGKSDAVDAELLTSGTAAYQHLIDALQKNLHNLTRRQEEQNESQA